MWLNKGVGEEKRWFYPSSAAIIGLAITIYGIWPMFYPYIQAHFGLETTASIVLAATFTSMGFMLIGPPIAGRILDKYGPKINYIISAILLFTGHNLVRLMISKTNWSDAMYLWYIASLFVGLGIGFSSGTYQSTVGKWFPDKTGTAMGLTMAGAGAGTIVYSPLINAYIKANGFSGNIFMYLGIIAVVVVLGLGLIWKVPTHDWVPEGMRSKANGVSGSEVKQVHLARDYTLSEAIRDKRFWVLYVCIISSAFSLMFFMQNVTLIIIEGLSNTMSEGEIMTTVVPVFLSLTALSALVGRFSWGVITDKIGGPWKTLWMVYLLPAIWMVLFYVGYQSKIFILINGCLFYFLSGGEPTLHAAIVPYVFGRRHLGTIMTTLFAISAGVGMAIGPFLGAYIKDVTGGYYWALVLAVIIRLIGTGAAIYGLRDDKKRNVVKQN